MIAMFLGWKLVKRTRFVRSMQMDLVTDRFDLNPASMLVSDSDAPDGDAQGEGEMEQTHSRQGILAYIEKNGVFRKAKRVGMWLFL